MPSAQLCSSMKEGRSEHLETPQLPLLLGVLKPVESGALGKPSGSGTISKQRGGGQDT